MDENVAAVRLRFPKRAHAIDELALRDVVFCEICRDYAEAQSELAKWNTCPDPVREERIAEYGELLAALGKEIEDALDRAIVVSIHRPTRPRPA
ncbi:hypothetical protein HGO37_19110 [Rhizobium sp. CG4]|jgi:hypothetical protein|uniref:hypothetical protein n=1 Tax=Rhizobium sp. CG4 TaxID=2726075 RepID=UPI002033F393|nr:hypothetical protein [Rhizobium sp. CG4]MCM2457514.1 hypothetical protein [Rhizobium sp. CG4]